MLVTSFSFLAFLKSSDAEFSLAVSVEASSVAVEINN
jgi:hypothetical protein